MVGSKDLPPSKRPFQATFICNQFFTKPQWPPAETDLSGKTAIVTGANVGLGYEAASQLLGLRLSSLIMAVRSTDKGKAAAAKLRALHPDASIAVWHLDMCRYESIAAFASRVEDELPHVDYVLLNAGLAPFSFRLVQAAEGMPKHEEALQVNYLSTMLLAVLLLPILKRKRNVAGGAPRLSIVSTGLALVAQLERRDHVPLLPALDSPEKYDGDVAYRDSKLLGQIFLWKLVDYVSAEHVVINLPDPGWTTGTDLMKDRLGTMPAPMKFIANATGRSLKDGASCLVDGLVAQGPESHGTFLLGWKVHPFNKMLYTSEGSKVIQRLWDETLAELEFAGVRGIIKSMGEA